MKPKPMRVLVLSGGHRNRTSHGVNVGDVAQLQHVQQLVKTLWSDASCVLVAHSPSDESPVSGLCYNTELVTYVVSKTRTSILPRSAVYLIRLSQLLFRARFPRAASWILSQDATASRVLNDIRTASVLLVSGAGVLNDKYAMGTAYFWSAVITIANALGVPVVLIGQQIGPLNGLISRAVIGFALRKADFVGVRDTQSKNVALAIGVPEERVRFTGDEGLYLESCAWDIAKCCLSNIGVSKPYIAAHFRIDQNCPFEEIKKQLASALDCLAKELNARVVFVPMSYAESDDDREASRAVIELMSSEASLIDLAGDAALTKSIIQNAKLAIGVANHFCVFAASAAVPTISIYATEYMEQKLVGLQELYHCVKAVRVEDNMSGSEIVNTALGHLRVCDERIALSTLIEKPQGYLDWLHALERR